VLTIMEFELWPDKSWQAVGIPNGWRPLDIFERENEHGIKLLVLAVQADTEQLEEREIIRMVRPGDDMAKAAETGELAFLGQAMGVYLFLDLPPEAPRRRITHPDLIAALEREKKNRS
jgi:hypothetical protein